MPLPATATISSEDEPEHVKMNTMSALVLLGAVTAFAYLTAEFLVDSLNGFVESHESVSKEWVTLIVIPVISNAAEHTTAVVVATKGKFDLAMSVAVGSCIQIALFVIPLLVLVAWGMGKPLTLLFDPLETLVSCSRILLGIRVLMECQVLFLSVILVKFSIEDGKSHYMSGVALVGSYLLARLRKSHVANFVFSRVPHYRVVFLEFSRDGSDDPRSTFALYLISLSFSASQCDTVIFVLP